MKTLKQILLYLLLCLNILLVFLSLVSDKLVVPEWLTLMGRLHPVFLHFPLALMLVSILLYFLRGKLGIQQRTIFQLLFFLGAISAAVTALLGLFLSTEGGYDEGTLLQHQWFGVGISVCSYLVFLAYQQRSGSGKWITVTSFASVVALLWGSHLGGVLTHGEDFLSFRSETEEAPAAEITDTSVVYASLIEPVFRTKCYSCHNDQKSKGELIMTSVDQLLKGGKSGKLWIEGDPLNSHIVERLDLPEEYKKHMPPKGKTQVTQREQALIEAWIQSGADVRKRIVDYPAQDSFRLFLARYIQKPVESAKSYGFAAASAKDIKVAQSPYCYISPVSAGSPALQVRFLIRSGFTVDLLKNLTGIRQQVVQINLANMPLKDEDISLLREFQNLEILNLNGTDITEKGIENLKENRALYSLAVSNTKVSYTGFEKLVASMPSLRQVYCWNTALDSNGLKKLQVKNPKLTWYLGFIPDKNELLQLTTAQLVDNDNFVLGDKDSVRFKHPMPGAIIRYTLDGSAPDSLHSPAYTTPLHFSKATRIRTIAVRQGWLTSDTTDHTFFVRSAIMPSFTRFVQFPDKNYTAQKEATLFDNRKGDPSNFREGFIGSKENPLELLCGFTEAKQVGEVLVSTLKNTGSYIMPPQRVELWAGQDTLNMKKISEVIPLQPAQHQMNRIDLQRLPVSGSYRYFRLKLLNVQKLPNWHDGRGTKGWVFLDEVFFN
jgi:hypothetical protein